MPQKPRVDLAGIAGPEGHLYADPQPSQDESAFQVDNVSDQYYQSAFYKANQYKVQPIPQPRTGAPLHLDLADFLPQNLLDSIDQEGKIVFHAVGDTGAAKSPPKQSVAVSIADEAAVADAMTADVQSGGDTGPAFFFHLGDIIYNFGEAQYYYDQFYEPYRDYDRPIFAIPGNHDGMVFGPTSTAPQVPTLAAFLTNFCAAGPGPSPDAPTVTRSVMTQPGAYFTLDAPFVSIIGLYSNVLDKGGGIISSRGGHFPLVDEQLTFLTSELARLKPDRQAGKRAIIVAVHHPPLSVDAKSGGSTALMQDIDACSTKATQWPDVVLSAHAHLYQRFTRTVNGRQVPYIVSGSGGFAATPPMGGSPPRGTVIGDHKLEIDPIVKFGYLTLTTDAKTITVTFKTALRNGGVTQRDSVTLDLESGRITASGGGAAPGPGPKPRKRPNPAPKPQKKKKGKG
ncbi:MAG TPA: metallophosphoesterase [Candidatus Sulfotelmatobacter sp.]|nr:metallophosphoesterase [Candidatus Sulfotelmatobacter sp.]